MRIMIVVQLPGSNYCKCSSIVYKYFRFDLDILRLFLWFVNNNSSDNSFITKYKYNYILSKKKLKL